MTATSPNKKCASILNVGVGLVSPSPWSASEVQSRLPLDTFEDKSANSAVWLAVDCHRAFFSRVVKLSVASPLADLKPSVALQDFKNLCYFYIFHRSQFNYSTLQR